MANQREQILDMRLHFVIFGAVLIGLVSGQLPYGNVFQESIFSSSGSRLQPSEGRQFPPFNINPNGAFDPPNANAGAQVGGVSANAGTNSAFFPQNFPQPFNPAYPSNNFPQYQPSSSSNVAPIMPPMRPFPPARPIPYSMGNRAPFAMQQPNRRFPPFAPNPFNMPAMNPLRVPPAPLNPSESRPQAYASSYADSFAPQRQFSNPPQPGPNLNPYMRNNNAKSNAESNGDNQRTQANKSRQEDRRVVTPREEIDSVSRDDSVDYMLPTDVPIEYPITMFPKGFFEDMLSGLGKVTSAESTKEAIPQTPLFQTSPKGGKKKNGMKRPNVNRNRQSKKNSNRRKKEKGKPTVGKTSSTYEIPTTETNFLTSMTPSNDITKSFYTEITTEFKTETVKSTKKPIGSKRKKKPQTKDIISKFKSKSKSDAANNSQSSNVSDVPEKPLMTEESNVPETSTDETTCATSDDRDGFITESSDNSETSTTKLTKMSNILKAKSTKKPKRISKPKVKNTENLNLNLNIKQSESQSKAESSSKSQSSHGPQAVSDVPETAVMTQEINVPETFTDKTTTVETFEDTYSFTTSISKDLKTKRKTKSNNLTTKLTKRKQKSLKFKEKNKEIKTQSQSKSKSTSKSQSSNGPHMVSDVPDATFITEESNIPETSTDQTESIVTSDNTDDFIIESSETVATTTSKDLTKKLTTKSTTSKAKSTAKPKKKPKPKDKNKDRKSESKTGSSSKSESSNGPRIVSDVPESTLMTEEGTVPKTSTDKTTVGNSDDFTTESSDTVATFNSKDLSKKLTTKSNISKAKSTAKPKKKPKPKDKNKDRKSESKTGSSSKSESSNGPRIVSDVPESTLMTEEGTVPKTSTDKTTVGNSDDFTTESSDTVTTFTSKDLTKKLTTKSNISKAKSMKKPQKRPKPKDKNKDRKYQFQSKSKSESNSMSQSSNEPRIVSDVTETLMTGESNVGETSAEETTAVATSDNIDGFTTESSDTFSTSTSKDITTKLTTKSNAIKAKSTKKTQKRLQKPKDKDRKYKADASSKFRTLNMPHTVSDIPETTLMTEGSNVPETSNSEATIVANSDSFTTESLDTSVTSISKDLKSKLTTKSNTSKGKSTKKPPKSPKPKDKNKNRKSQSKSKAESNSKSQSSNGPLIVSDVPETLMTEESNVGETSAEETTSVATSDNGDGFTTESSDTFATSTSKDLTTKLTTKSNTSKAKLTKKPQKRPNPKDKNKDRKYKSEYKADASSKFQTLNIPPTISDIPETTLMTEGSNVPETSIAETTIIAASDNTDSFATESLDTFVTSITKKLRSKLTAMSNSQTAKLTNKPKSKKKPKFKNSQELKEFIFNPTIASYITTSSITAGKILTTEKLSTESESSTQVSSESDINDKKSEVSEKYMDYTSTAAGYTDNSDKSSKSPDITLSKTTKGIKNKGSQTLTESKASSGLKGKKGKKKSKQKNPKRKKSTLTTKSNFALTYTTSVNPQDTVIITKNRKKKKEYKKSKTNVSPKTSTEVSWDSESTSTNFDGNENDYKDSGIPKTVSAGNYDIEITTTSVFPFKEAKNKRNRNNQRSDTKATKNISKQLPKDQTEKNKKNAVSSPLKKTRKSTFPTKISRIGTAKPFPGKTDFNYIQSSTDDEMTPKASDDLSDNESPTFSDNESVTSINDRKVAKTTVPGSAVTKRSKMQSNKERKHKTDKKRIRETGGSRSNYGPAFKSTKSDSYLECSSHDDQTNSDSKKNSPITQYVISEDKFISTSAKSNLSNNSRNRRKENKNKSKEASRSGKGTNYMNKRQQYKKSSNKAETINIDNSDSSRQFTKTSTPVGTPVSESEESPTAVFSDSATKFSITTASSYVESDDRITESQFKIISQRKFPKKSRNQRGKKKEKELKRSNNEFNENVSFSKKLMEKIKDTFNKNQNYEERDNRFSTRSKSHSQTSDRKQSEFTTPKASTEFSKTKSTDSNRIKGTNRNFDKNSGNNQKFRKKSKANKNQKLQKKNENKYSRKGVSSKKSTVLKFDNQLSSWDRETIYKIKSGDSKTNRKEHSKNSRKSHEKKKNYASKRRSYFSKGSAERYGSQNKDDVTEAPPNYDTGATDSFPESSDENESNTDDRVSTTKSDDTDASNSVPVSTLTDESNDQENTEADTNNSDNMMTTAESKITTNQDKTTKTGNEATTTKGEITTAQNEMTTAEKEVSSAHSDITTVEEKITTTENGITETGEQITTPQNEITTTEEEITNTEKEITPAVGEITTNKNGITTAEEENTTKEISTSEKEITSTERKITTVEVKITTAENKIATTGEEEIVTEKSKTTTSKEEITTDDNKTTTNKEEIATSEEDITTQEEDITTTEDEITSIEKEITTDLPDFRSTLSMTFDYPFDYSTEIPPPGVECRKNERYYKCVPHCRHTCFNYDNYEVPCPTFCQPGCFCDPGLVVNEDGDCVETSQCKNYTCDDDQEWWECKPQYGNTCENFARAEARVDSHCESGCFCYDGLVQTSDGKCVEPDDCPDPVCNGHEHEADTDCMNPCNTCAATCLPCSMEMCRPGCDCVDGYKRDTNGTCIQASTCPACLTAPPDSDSTTVY